MMALCPPTGLQEPRSSWEVVTPAGQLPIDADILAG